MPATLETPPIPETHTTPASTDIPQGAPSTGAKPSSFRAPNPAFDAVAARLMKRANRGQPTSAETPKPTEAPPAAPKEAPKAETKAAETETKAAPTETPEPKPETEAPKSETPKEGETQPQPEPVKDKKVSPWRLVDQWKATANDYKAKAEKATQELEALKAGKPVELPKEVSDKISAQEAKIKEYEDHIRFLDYQRHPEFLEKFSKPYENAWKLATSELAEVTVTDPNTQATRAATAEDMLALINLPLGKAREYANQMFGEFADDAMAHRKTIKGLFDAQQAALKEAKDNGAARIKAFQEQSEAAQKEVQTFIGETWQKEDRLAVTDDKYGKFFTPIEGDQKGNAALAQGLKTVDEVFKAPNIADPSLSKEDRAKLARKLVRFGKAAAAFPRMCQWLEERDATIAALKAELEAYKKSEPPSTPQGQSQTPTTGKGDFYAELAARMEKKAHR